ncbi:cardiolipin synthase [Anaerocolumna aminovalerica]|uniref:cardiolipin synthase n=1 Tax=Anaerocolumna aminovalerica TaxID=1527 RepID=UPI001C0F04F1|nr:cardiolipin synthase [Anaerocolumna aminovalerica]MBU5332418.1 cardiolipin synthase [Anaerocolumna aminovalerica]
MNKIKFITSKVLIPFIVILAEIFLFIIMVIKYHQYFVLYYIVKFIISLIAMLWIINKRMNPTFIVTWLFTIFLFPVFGVLVYILYGGKLTGKKMQAELNSIYSKIQSDFSLGSDAILSELKEIDIHAYRQANYIKGKSLCPIYKNSSCTYFPSGEASYNDIMNALKSAKEFIFLEFFIIKEGVFWDGVLDILTKKVKEGVDVRIIYDEVGSLFTLPAHYDKKLRSLGIKCHVFRPYSWIFSTVSTNLDHCKILLVDGKAAFTGGFNLSDEYINVINKHGYWKDSVIRVKGDAVQNFTAMFLSTWGYLDGSTEDASPFHKVITLSEEDNPSGFVQPYNDTPLDYEGVGETVYLNLINKATDYVYITAPYLIIDSEMVTALRNAAKSGVDVRIITPYIPDKKIVFMMSCSFYPVLMESGVKIYEFTPGFIHSKNIIVDDLYGVVGSINLDYRSLYFHFECGVWMYKSECIMDMKKDFLSTIEESKLIYYEKSKYKNCFKRFASSILRIFAPLF